MRSLVPTTGFHSLSPYQTLNPGDAEELGVDPSAKRSAQLRIGRAGVSGSGGRAVSPLRLDESPSSGAMKMTSPPTFCEDDEPDGDGRLVAGIVLGLEVGKVVGFFDPPHIHFVISPVTSETRWEM